MNRQTTKPQSRRCIALRRDGQPCRAWALRPSPGQTHRRPPLCAAHASNDEDAQGASIAGHAQSDATALTVHQTPPSTITLGGNKAFYAPGFTDEELGALEAITEPNSLEGEIMMVRGQLRRLVLDSRVNPPLERADDDHRATTLFTGARTLSHMLQAERELERDADGVPRPIAEALDEIGEEWGIDL